MSVCLPTGATPAPAYRRFVDRGGSLADASVTLLDEFVLPIGNPARCDVMLERTLLSLLEERPKRYLSWDTEAKDLDEMCMAMDRSVVAMGLDLVILGIGTNGHIGLNEPGTSIDAPTRVVSIHASTARATARYGADEAGLPELGVTLGMGTLLSAAEIWLLATGAGKADVIAAAVEGPVGPDVPASYLRMHDGVTVMLDEHAASALS